MASLDRLPSNRAELLHIDEHEHAVDADEPLTLSRAHMPLEDDE